MASNEWLVRKLHEQDKKIEALSRGGTGVGHSSIAPGENLTVISDNGEVVLGAGGVEHVDGPTPATPSAPTLKLGFGTIETTWDGSFAEGEDEDGVPLTAPVDFDVVEVHCSTDPEEEEWGEDTMRGQIKTAEGGTITVGGFDVDDEVFVCLIALAKTGKRSAPSATASLVIEGLDFSQLFTEIDAANATIKNAGEVLVTEQDTLNDKLTDAFGQIEDAITSANGKNVVHYEDAPPTTADAGVEGDTWFVGQFGRPTDVVQATNLWTGSALSQNRSSIASTTSGSSAEQTDTGLRITTGPAPTGAYSLTYTTSSGYVIPEPNKVYSWRIPIKNYGPSAMPVRATAWLRDTSNATYSSASDAFVLESGEQRDIVIENMASGPSPQDLRFSLYYSDNSSKPVQGTQFELLDGITVTATASAQTSFNGDTPSGETDNESHYRWTGEPYASTSEKYLPATEGLSPNWNVTEQYRFVNGAWENVELSHTVLSSLDLGKLVAGSAAIKEAVVQKLWAEVVVTKMAVAEQFIGENAILTGAVTAPKITASEELWAKIAQFVKIRAEHIEADAIDGMVITGATIRSAATGARTLMSASGFEAYNTANERTFFASASTGEVSMIGKLFTGKPGFSRVAIDPTLWSSLPVYDGAGGIAGYASGAGVRVGVDASSSADFYHAALSNGATSGVFRSSSGKSVVSVEDMPLSGGRSLSSVEIFGEVSEGKTYARFGDGIYATYNDKADSSYSSTFFLRKDSSLLETNSGDYSSYVEAGSGFAGLSSSKNDNEFYSTVYAGSSSIDMFASYSPRGSTAVVQLVNGTSSANGYVNIAAEHINPLRVNYLGTGASWIVPFRKSGTDWGYVGSSGAMGVNDFGIQSASGKNLNLRASGGAEIILTSDTGSDARVKSMTIASVKGGTTSDSAPVVIRPSSGVMYTPSSSARYKQDIGDAREMASILDVQTRRWRDRGEVESVADLERFRKDVGEGPVPREFADIPADPPFHFGAIAEEVDDLGLSELVRYDAYGRPDGLHYEMFGVALIPEVRKLRDRITELERLTNE